MNKKLPKHTAKIINVLLVYFFVGFSIPTICLLSSSASWAGEGEIDIPAPIPLKVGVPQGIEGETIELAFFNVGQGNCTIVKAPNKQDIFIIDAGSSALPNENIDQATISFAVKDWILKSSQKTYNVHFILSHADRDHYNLMAPICAAFPLKEEKPIAKFMYYQNEHSSSLKSYSEVQKLQNALEEFVSSQDIIKLDGGPLYHKDNLEISLFNKSIPYLSSVQNKETNDNSLVFKLAFHQHTIFLTGDATGETFEIKGDRVGETTPGTYIEEFKADKAGKLREKKPINVIFQAAHHGAVDQGANSAQLIHDIGPNITVFSAPRYSQYRHPCYEVVERVAQYYKEQKVSLLQTVTEPSFSLYHLYFLDKTIDSSELEEENNKFNHEKEGMFEPRIVYRDSKGKGARKDGLYSAYLTNYPLFHTGSHGTIIFTLTNNSAFIDTYDYGEPSYNESASSSSSSKAPKVISGMNLKRTTDEIFKTLDDHNTHLKDLLGEEKIKGYLREFPLSH